MSRSYLDKIKPTLDLSVISQALTSSDRLTGLPWQAYLITHQVMEIRNFLLVNKLNPFIDSSTPATTLFEAGYTRSGSIVKRYQKQRHDCWPSSCLKLKVILFKIVAKSSFVEGECDLPADECSVGKVFKASLKNFVVHKKSKITI